MEAIRLLVEADVNPIDQTIERFRALFYERFPSKVMELSLVPFDIEITELHQRTGESITIYYKRVINIILRVSIKDRLVPPTINTLGSLKAIILNTILKAFIKGLTDYKIRKEATRGIASIDRSLLIIYNLAKEARRTNTKIKKLYNKESRSDELAFYKNLI